MVADALSRKSIAALRAHHFQLRLTPDGALIAQLKAKPDLLQQVADAQNQDDKMNLIMRDIQVGRTTEFILKEDGKLYYQN